MAKNIQISFRLSEYQLAHGLEILRGLEPSYKPSSLTAMVKLIVEDWIAKMSAATKPWPSDQSQQEIKLIMQETAAGRRAMARQDNDLELTLIGQDVARSVQALCPPGLLARGTKDQATQATIEVRQATEEQTIAMMKQTTASITKVVTDFSPPSMEELLNGQEEIKND